MDASPLQSSPIVSKASLWLRPNSRVAHPYPWSDKGSGRGESRPHSPSSLSKRFQSGEGEGEGEGAGDHSRTEKSRQGNLGSHPAASDPPDRTDIILSVRPLTSCPLAARPLVLDRQLPSRGHRDSTRNLCSGRAWNRPPFIKVHRGPTGNTRSRMTHYCSHMPTLTRISNKAAPTTPEVVGTSAIQRGSLASSGPALQNAPVCRP